MNCLSAAHVTDKRSTVLKKQFKGFVAKLQHDIHRRETSLEKGDENINSNHESNKFQDENVKPSLISGYVKPYSKLRDKEYLIPKTDNQRDRIERLFDKISNIPEISNPDIKQGKVLNGKRDDEEITSQSSYIDNDKKIGVAPVGDIINRKRRWHNNMTAAHRLVKRNVNTSQSTAVILTDPPFLLPPTPVPPTFRIPPVCTGSKSCSGRCMGNVTGWRTVEKFECYCDTACYEVFHDCCTDYTKYCGDQKPNDVLIKRFNWSCEPLGNVEANDNCQIGDGLWMVKQCANDWPHDDIRSNCENPAKFIQAVSDLNRYVPAFSGNITFRNYFCAECNGFSQPFEYFPVEIKTNVIPPEHYNFSQKVDFLLSNGAEFPNDGPTRPKASQPRRYCLKSLVNSCPVNTTSQACTNGPIAPVGGINEQFKNHDCALCNENNGFYSCFPTFSLFKCKIPLSYNFHVNLDYKHTNDAEDSVIKIQSESCDLKGLTYDNKLQECAKVFRLPSDKDDKIRVLVWFVPTMNFRFDETDFKKVMKEYFGVKDSQVHNVSIETVPNLPTGPNFNPRLTISYHLVTSTLLLTPEQSFDTLFQVDTDSFALNLGSFLHFQKPLIVTVNNITYTIIKTTSRPLSCTTRNVYTKQEYVILDNEAIRVASTSITYQKWEYYREINGSITICEKYSPSNCAKIKTGLKKSEFIINSDLSLYEKSTGNLYKLGQYDVDNNFIALCNLEQSDIPTCSIEKSCKGRCSNRTDWQTELKMRCSCDPDCHEVFNDCCSDYTMYCGSQKESEKPTKKYNFTCESIGHYDHNHCAVSDGLWMVNQCRFDWPLDNFRAKCEEPLDHLTISSPDLYSYLPVIDRENITFRNMYCAICNGIKNYDLWPLNIETAVIPLENYNLTEKIRFLLSHHAEFPEVRGPWRPGTNQARRYCVKNVVDYCPPDETVPSCNDGDVALVSYGHANFKNTHCAACHGLSSEMLTCFPGKALGTCYKFSAQSFSLVLQHNQDESQIQTRVTVYDERCGRTGMVFDDILQVCRVNWLSPPERNGQERFYVYNWLKPPKNSEKNNSFAPVEFRDSLANFLNISKVQLFNTNVTSVSVPKTSSFLFYLASSTIALFPQQSLELISPNNRNAISQSLETKLRNYIYFTHAFTLPVNRLHYTVIKTTSRPLACVGKRTYSPKEYTLNEKEQVIIQNTNKTYEKFQYYRQNVEKSKPGNITVCEKYVPAYCDGFIVEYTNEEYKVLLNLSVYINKTSSLYDYGEYEIYSNKSVGICQHTRVRVINETRKTIRENKTLGYITLIFFLLSILSLIFLLVTYILFPQLRTLPGKNLMNFAASLLFFMIFWLPSNFTEVLTEQPTCTAFAILEHYFLMVTFVSMSVIAFHTCKVFARNVPAPKMSPGHERKLLCIYMVMVWLVPAVFIAICVVLDDQDVVKLGYGESEICWLTVNNAYTYFVTIPIAVLLLFNTVAFGITALYLRKHGQNRAAKQASGNRKSNLWMYVRLSTLMGFTWLFGLLALVLNSTIVFWYFFVIFTSLQGVFVSVAFAMNAKTLSLYKHGHTRHNSRPSKPITTERNLPKNIYNDTKL